MLHWEIIVIKTSWKLECFQVLKAQRTAWKHPESSGRLVYVVGVCIFSCLSFFFLVLSGIIGERLPIRCYLTFGMLASGAFTALFGVGYFYNIHSFGFYVITQVRSGYNSGEAHHTLGFHHELDGVFMSLLPREYMAEDGRGGRAVSCLKSGSALDHTAPSLSSALRCQQPRSVSSCQELPLKESYLFLPQQGDWSMKPYESFCLRLDAFEMLCPVTDLTAPELGDVGVAGGGEGWEALGAVSGWKVRAWQSCRGSRARRACGRPLLAGPALPGTLGSAPASSPVGNTDWTQKRTQSNDGSTSEALQRVQEDVLRSWGKLYVICSYNFRHRTSKSGCFCYQSECTLYSNTEN